MTGIVVLLDNAGEASGVDVVGDFETWHGGFGDLWVSGDFGGGMFRMEATLNDGFVTCVTGTQTSIPGVTKFNFNHGTKIRGIVSDTASPSSGVNAKVN